MTNVHRRRIADTEPRCAPHPPDCPIKDTCARFTVGMPQGLGATMDNFRRYVPISAPVFVCGHFLSSMVSDDELAAETKKSVKPAIGAKR